MKNFLTRLTRSAGAKGGWKPAVLIFMVSIYPLIVIPGERTGYILTKYIALALAAAAALFQVISGRSKINRHPALIPLAAFAVFALVSTVLAPHPVTAWFGMYRHTGFVTYLFCMILFLLAAADIKEPEKIIKWMAGAAALLSLIALLQYLGLNIIQHHTHQAPHAFATLGNRNHVGTYTVFILPAAIFFYLRSQKMIWLGCAALIYGGLLATLTRGAWIALPLPLLILFCHFYREAQNRKHILILCIVLLLVTCLLAPVHDWMLAKRVFTIKGEVSLALELNENAGTERFYLWKEAIKLFPAHWAFGIGPDHLSIPVKPGFCVDKAHNIYIEILVTMGLFAFISYLAFLSYFLRRWKNETGFLFFLMISTYLLQGSFITEVIGVMPLFWITLGLSLANIKASTAAPGQQGSPCRPH